MNIELLIIFLIFILSYVLILKNFKLSIYLLLILSVLLHKELFSFYRWDLMPVRAVMVSYFCAGLTRIYFYLYNFLITKKVKKLNFKPILDPFILLLLSLWSIRALSIVNSKNLQSSVLLLAFFSTIVFFSFQFYNYLKEHKDLPLKYINFYIVIAFLLTLFGYFQYFLYSTTQVIIGAFWNIPGNIARVGATFWDVNHYGAFLAVILPLSFLIALYQKSTKNKIIYFIMFLSILVTLLLTNSRTAWIIDAVGFLIFSIIFLFKKYGKKSIVLFFLALTLVSIPLVLEYNDKDSRFRAEIRNFFHYRMDSFASHIMLVIGSYQIFQEYPIIGGGYGGFFEHFSQTEIAPTFFGRDPAALTTRVPPHTIWGESMSETGIIGLTLWSLLTILVSVVLFKATFKAKDFKDFLLLNAMFSVFIGWMTAGIFYSYNAEFFWILITLFFAYGVNELKSDYKIEKLIKYVTSFKHFTLFTILFLSVFMIFTNLWVNNLVPWDEAIYAKISKNMVNTGEYLTLFWKNSTPWYEKPPLFMWLMAFSMNILGITSFAAKLPSAIFGVSTVIVTYLIGKKLFSKTVGFLSAFSLLTTMHFLYYSRMAMTDITNLFFIASSLYLFLLSTDKKKNNLYSVGIGLLIGLGTMTKGVVGLIPFAIIGLYQIYLLLTKQDNLNKIIIKKYLLMFSAFLFAVLPWHLYMYFKFGTDFIDQYIGYHVISRATTAIEDKGAPWNWYFIVIRVSMRIWFISLLGAITWLVFYFSYLVKNSKLSLKILNKYIFVLIWSIFVFAFFSVAKSKLVWYIIPIYPALTILSAIFIDFIINFLSNKIFKSYKLVFKSASLLFIFIFTMMYIFYNFELYYPTNTTRQVASLLQLKDEKLGTEEMFYIDRVELPLVMFYTDSPFNIIDYHPQKGRFPVISYNESVAILAKRGRYEIEIPNMPRDIKIIGEEEDYVLFHIESQKEYDEKVLKDVNKQLNRTDLTPQRIEELKLEQQRLLNEINK